MILPFCARPLPSLWADRHRHGIFPVLSASWKPRIRADQDGATHGWVWALSFGPLDIFRWSWGWPNGMKIRSGSQTTARSQLWGYIKRKGSIADSTKVLHLRLANEPLVPLQRQRGIWFRAISLMWCGLLASIMYHLVRCRKLIKEVWKSFGPIVLPQNM